MTPTGAHSGYSEAKATTRTLYLLDAARYRAWLSTRPAPQAQWLEAQGFTASPGSLVLLPGAEGLEAAVLGIGDPLDPYSYAHAPQALPGGDWTPHFVEQDGANGVEGTDPSAAGGTPPGHITALQLGWGLGAYRFDRYKVRTRAPARLSLAHHDAETDALLAACLQVRDLVNTPSEHLGPDELEAAARALATQHGAILDVITGDALLERNFPAIHAVGRASHRAPRLIALEWGDPAHPRVAVVGKGVCFDTGGLDLKPADGMRNMKKDMGGAAHALALASLVMARRLPLRLQLLIPAVENAIGPLAYRPGEVVATRKGLSVEIDNTDAEGRVVLCDALAYAGETSPELVLDFATLTGAARVALGPDLPALFANDEALAADWLAAAARVRDPVWRMPLWRPYLRYLTSHVADLANAGSRMAGAVTAALYLERFVPADTRWAHIDVYAWNDNDRPGRPTGGEALSLRSAFELLKTRYPAE